MAQLKNGETYVTYKWLFVQAVSIIIIVMGAVYFTVGHFSRATEILVGTKLSREVYDSDTKADIERYAKLCTDLALIQKTVEDNRIELNSVSKNQLLVLRHLRIDPVK
jgi:hypothetical protein